MTESNPEGRTVDGGVGAADLWRLGVSARIGWCGGQVSGDTSIRENVIPMRSLARSANTITRSDGLDVGDRTESDAGTDGDAPKASRADEAAEIRDGRDCQCRQNSSGSAFERILEGQL